MTDERKAYILGGVVLFITALFSKGFHHFDEHFQILEFAALKLNIAKQSDMPWEYFYKMRSAAQPAMVIIIYRFFNLFSLPDPFIIATLTRILSAMVSFLGIALALKTFLPQIQNARLKQVMILLSFFTWFIVYNNVRFSSENWSGNLFLIGLCISLSKTENKWKRFFFAGCLMGLSFIFRFQSGLLILGFLVWMTFIQKERFSHIAQLCLGIFLSVVTGFLIDRWFYGEWTFTAWNYLDQNIIHNTRAAGFGIQPWYYYVTEVFSNSLPPFSIIYIMAVVLFFFFYPKHIITFILFPFLFVHVIIGHKELRFLFPIMCYLPVMIIMVAEEVKRRWHLPKLLLQSTQIFVFAFWIINMVLLIVVIFRPADSLNLLYEKLYHQYKEPAILYYVNDNPYHRVLDIHFYKRPELELVQTPSIDSIKPEHNKKILFFTNQYINSAGNRWHMVYSGLPAWVRKFDFNNWQKRSNPANLYELKTD